MCMYVCILVDMYIYMHKALLIYTHAQSVQATASKANPDFSFRSVSRI